MTSFVSRLVSAAKLIRFNHSRSDRSFIACRCRTRLAGVFCLSLVLGYQPSTGCVLNSVWFISSAQIIRAFLAANATAALLYPRRSTNSFAQRLSWSSLLASLAITARVPWINNVRRYLSPRLVILPNRGLPPVEYCRGTRPSQAAKCLPLLNCLGSGARSEERRVGKECSCRWSTDHQRE